MITRICSLLTMEPAAYIDYKLQIQGLFFLGLIVGVVLAEILFSGRLSDWVVRRLTFKNGGQRVPEMRLWLGYPAAVGSSIGLIVWGLSIDREWHWITGQVAFFLCTSILRLIVWLSTDRSRCCWVTSRKYRSFDVYCRQLSRTCDGSYHILYRYHQRM